MQLALRHGGILTLAGIGLGAGASVLVAPVLASMLVAVPATDPSPTVS
ncbi:MAG: hypothetical protein H0W08_06090 [Acidobacteria bacterium]|nr:hypothetical protein [Acidobacteriota bacterium]